MAVFIERLYVSGNKMDRLLKCFLANCRVKYSKKNLLNLACRRIYSYLWRINQAFLLRNHNYSSSINQKISNMKLSLRSFALGAAMTALGAMNAQEPVVTQKWFTQEGLPAEGNSTNYRNGNGVNGKIYIANAAEIIEIDGSAPAGSQSKVVYTHTSALNRGFTMDAPATSLSSPHGLLRLTTGPTGCLFPTTSRQ